MKILYAIQGTGNGHLARAIEILPILQRKGKVDILISGIQCDLELPFEIKYNLKGLSFIFGKKGGIDFLETYKKSSLRQLFKEVKALPIEKYDLVINDFEPVSAWACRLNNIPCIGLSHQSAVINKNSPRPDQKDLIGHLILKKYAPVNKAFGFHFETYDDNIFTPVIRSQIRNSRPVVKDYYTVYLPAYSDEIMIKLLSKIEHVNWQIFSKNTKNDYKIGNIKVRKINNDTFVNSIVKCKGILCGAGFETPAEALFLKKKLMVIPMKGQYEQQCNAAALSAMGVKSIKSLKKSSLPKIENWIDSEQEIIVNYQDDTNSILDLILEEGRLLAYEEKDIKKISTKKYLTNSFNKLLGQLNI